jgi:transcriptional regulator with GAF, ATPase, and Fis domain
MTPPKPFAGATTNANAIPRYSSETKLQRGMIQSMPSQPLSDAAHGFSATSEAIFSASSGILGASVGLCAVLRHIQLVAGTDTTVLIQGETGTGKECMARALHQLSARAAGPFIKVNCAAIPAALLESELMGHERGAFTGATARRLGRFELAQGGTIFLDEVGELPLDLQPKLLRLLQEREFERLGGARTLHTNARVLAATNRDLRTMVAERAFREDLYYRLSVFPIVVPPLRERSEDIPLLARHFVRASAARLGRVVEPPSPSDLDRLRAYAWPGNIRELQNVLERAVILAEGGLIQLPVLAEPRPQDVPPRSGEEPARGSPEASPGGAATSEALADASRAHILRILAETNWVVSGPAGAAARLDMKRTTLNFRMKKLGIVRRGRDAPSCKQR